ncbi:MAG: hypothetical protein Greene041619_852 [Candidatus Peregrinibacteria bacterium Greene0416_19]|nr:MAG: hypothetical protein Greene041619_852 [Candidatus Peregrinibacteria bacterium Greene0416_19]
MSTIPHRIERTRNRTSRAVLKGDVIVIRLARSLTASEERRHIESLLRRMGRVVIRERARAPIDPFAPLLDGGDELALTITNDRLVRFRLVPGSSTKARWKKDGWDVRVSPHLRRQQLHRLLWKLLAERELPHLETLVLHINDAAFGERTRSVRLGYAATQWGSCSRRGDIMLNAALLLVPEPLLHYVICHELAHIRHPNHSKTYWQTVERAFPDYRAAIRTLRGFRICSL